MNTILVWLLFLPGANGYLAQAPDKYASQSECQRVASVALAHSGTSPSKAICVQANIIKEST